MIDTTENGHSPATLPATDQAEVLRLTDQQRARLAMYIEQVGRAQAALNEAFANILIGRGVDLERFEARLSPDGACALVSPRGATALEQGG